MQQRDPDIVNGEPPPLEPSEAAYRQTLLGQIDRRVFQDRRVRVGLLVLLAIILIIPSVQFVLRIQEVDPSPFREGGQRHRTALGRWLPTAELAARMATEPTENTEGVDQAEAQRREQGAGSGERQATERRSDGATEGDAAGRGRGPLPVEGQSPYGFGHWFPLPPFVLLSLGPLAKLGVVPAGIIWAVAKFVGLFVSIGLLVAGMGRADFRVPVGVLVMTGVFALRPVIADIQHGNVNIFMLVWLALTWAMFLRGRDGWAGLFLGLAIVTKITPALALVYFLYKRAWRLCIWTGVALLLLFVVVPGLYFGFAENFGLLRDWFDMLIAPYALHGYAALDVANQSVYGVIVRLALLDGFMPIDQISVHEAAEAGMDAMGRPALLVGRLIRPAIGLVVVGSLAWLCRTSIKRRRDPRLLLEFGLVLVAMLLLSERTWKHHSTTLVIVFLGVWTALACLPWSRRFRFYFVLGLITQWLLLVGTSEGLLGDRVAFVLLLVGAFCWGLLLCFAQTGVMLYALQRRGHRRPEPEA